MGWLHDHMMECINLGLTDALHEEGYESKRGRRWRLAGDDYIRHVAILGRSNTWSFQISLSISYPAITRIISYQPHDAAIRRWYPTFANVEFSPLPAQARLRNLVPALPVGSGFWQIIPQTDLLSLGLEIVSAWEQYGRPWMEYLSDLKNLRSALLRQHDSAESTGRGLYNGFLLIDAAAVSIALHDLDDTRRLIEKFSSMKQEPRLVDRVSVLQAFIDSET